MTPAAVLAEIARKIIFVQALHDDHDRAFLLVIEPRHQSPGIPFDHALARRLR
jgi:hypothetical protein